ncbi:MAG: hypothetical protein RI973_586 [Bacteroidota bacterium]|jgi:type 1 glutamine amidotransferase
MKKIIKIALWSLLALLLLVAGALGLFIYKVKHGFPVTYETEQPALAIPEGKKAILVFSKTTGFRHSESIAAGKQTLASLAAKNDWYLHDTEAGGVFNPGQLSRFHAVIFNNSTGRVLNDEQQQALEQYVENGGTLIGIHGAGDDSHRWPWYEQNLLGAKFSHHPIEHQLQEAQLQLDSVTDRALTSKLPSTWTHTEEWYVFFSHPAEKGFQTVYHIDGEKIDPNGNMLWTTDKNFGMGRHHPVAWYRRVGKGRTFYTSIGHEARAWEQEPFVHMLENALVWQ